MPTASYPIHELPRGEIHQARAEAVYPLVDTGSVSLLISDGPYAMNKAAWDRMDVDGLADWYAPHIEQWGDVCAPSATVYLWNTAEGWARLDPVMRAMGWVFRSLIVWHKPDGCAVKSAYEGGARCFPDMTEVCGMYQREAWAPSTCAGQEISYAAGRDSRNWVRLWLREEWLDSAGLRSRQCDDALGTNGMAGHYFGSSQWALPTWKHYQIMHRYAQEHGTPRDRPYLVHPLYWPGPDHLRASYDHLRASYDHLREEYGHLREEYDHLREEYEASRPYFNCPRGVGNVWKHNQVGGRERLKDASGGTLHPCQKPLAFYNRIILASSRPGDLVLEPFAGTCRTAFAIEGMDQSDARRYICIEPDEDGQDYIRHVLRGLQLDLDGLGTDGQISLFGGAL